MPRSERYSAVARLLHWSVAALLLATLVDGWVWPRLMPSETRMLVSQVHRQAGCVVLLLVVFRCIIRLRTAAPAPLGPALTRYTAKFVHAVLYLLMLAQPLSGLANLNERNGVNFLGWHMEPTPVPFLDNLLVEPARFWTEVHYDLGLLLSSSIGLHLLAVIWHQFIKRDNVLARMLPPSEEPRRRA